MSALYSVLIADPIHESGRNILDSDARIRADVETGLDEGALVARIGDYDALIVRSKTKVTRPVIEAASRLRAVGRAGIGVDNIDIPSATERGIVVFNTPDANATTTAELSIAHLMSLSRNLPQADRAVRGGEWKPARYSGVELSGKTIGVIGFGTIGRLVAERCAALKMRVLAYDPFVAPEIMSGHGAEAANLETLLASADYVTLHCPLSDKTHHLLDARRLASMKPGARIVNCARGGLIDEVALLDALRNGHLAGAALDVYEAEPPTGSALLTLDNVVFTPHLGASTEEAQQAVSLRIAEDMIKFLTTGAAETAVNLPRVTADQLTQTGPYQGLAYALGRLVGALCEGPISRLDVHLFGRVAELDSRPITAEALVGLLSQRMTGRVNRVNAGHLAREQGIEVTESRTEEARDFVSLVEISAQCCGQTTTVAGTLLGGSHARLVRIDGYDVEAVPKGNFLFTRHQDQPGVVGALGSILGRENINISRMQVGVGYDSDTAIALISISASLSAAAMDEIRSLPPIEQAVGFAL
ncbi:phosphoglycerate dehydrogenase [Methyloceanibacter caenitepidi]|uniref:D-3-phosphoglycerate dehydrogenase n=1 Tax=Methyloceanibacter caenitepidi TaxID=1384459 RepID=A0A0A8K1D8_9HYPH|nr:phosphoglycerate dehydrogenase [Methyloceanibacter caenitepidi]BAQ16778.1 D-3-phosphoglycerate dehydrogenase [Methyloceanibacter caenitepidi]